MAIISISRLQQRRGLRADLPINLNEAEIGWCLDTREMFIGNGNTYTGNSQILTQWSPNDQLIKHVYVGDTGISASTGPTVRTLGSVLDDTLCVKDYGAVGDGVHDDTAAIQAAIVDEWARISANPSAYAQSRNAIYFPAGNYVITASIKLYPYITLIGDGVNRSIITFSQGYVGPVLRTADSLGQTGANIGTNGGILPTSISVTGFTFNGGTNETVLLQRCTNVDIESCELIGTWSSGATIAGAINGATIESLGTATNTQYINFNNVIFRNYGHGIYSQDPIDFVTVDKSTFIASGVGIGLLDGPDSGPGYVKISNSIFRDLDSYGLHVTTTRRGISSINNSYLNVGTEYTQPSIYWDASVTSCVSIGDVFGQTNPTLRIYNGAPSETAVFNSQTTELVKNTPTPLSVPIAANQVNASTGITFSLAYATNMLTAWIDYSIVLDTYRKNGRLSIISDTTTVQLSDTSTELNLSESVVFSATIVGTDVVINYTSTGTTTGAMSYITTHWTS